jgi:tryptophan 2,3-dioxygenase
MSKGDPADNGVREWDEDGLPVFAARIDGEEIVWDSGLTYARHIQTEALLKTQVPVSDKPDEMLFIVMHQTMELWLKLLLHETAVLIADLRADRVARADKTIERMATVVGHMTHSWEVLATLTPHDFLTFRGFLRRASGFQSHQYRLLEFTLGTKRADMMLVHKDDSHATAALQAALDAPSLYDELLMLLARRGFTIPADKLERDWSQPYQPSEAVEEAWMAVYTDPDSHRDLYALAERVTALEYRLQEWRFKHMKTVARVIGQKPGTGGSAGVDYLVKALGLTFFPELWSMRTRMTAPREGGNYYGGGGQ